MGWLLSSTTTEVLGEVAELYDRGLYLQAWRAGLALGQFREWPGTAGRLLAGRLAHNLGAHRAGRWLHLTASRADPENLDARLFHALALRERRGPRVSWNFVRQPFDDQSSDAVSRAHWYALRAMLSAEQRDFEAADAWMAKADDLATGEAWIEVDRCAILRWQDRIPEALRVIEASLERRPWYRPAVQSAAELMLAVGRDRDARELLEAATQRLESMFVILQLADLLTELTDYSAAQIQLNRIVAEYPLLESGIYQSLACRLSDVACERGDLTQAVRLARQSQWPFHLCVAKNLEQPQEAKRRVLLPVGFVQQHHVTCAPATLAAIAEYWSHPASHLEIAEEICYNGTPPYLERDWSRQNGFVAREFTVTWEVTQTLLDRGIPFTLTTIGPARGHLQAVIGYDSRRGTLLIRDPSARHFSEMLADEGLAHYRSTGPRGMVLLPHDRAHLLEDVELPDAELYDQLDTLQRSLARHDRETGQAIQAAMSATAPQHPLTLLGRRILAAYDADPTAILHCAEQMLEQFPQDALCEISKLSALRQLTRREERVDMLRTICTQPQADPYFWQMLAEELLNDARERPLVRRALRHVIRARGDDSAGYHLLANHLWEARDFSEALIYYRIAACLNVRDERMAQSYFQASRHLRRTDEALRFLSRRFEQLGEASSFPGQTLAWAYLELHQVPAALSTIEAALAKRPNDGELLLYAAATYGRLGKLPRAGELLRAASGSTSRVDWLRTAAALATGEGNVGQALEYWQEVASTQPLSVEAQAQVARLMAMVEGRQKAGEYLAACADRFPHNYGLRQLQVEWEREGSKEAREDAVRKLVEIDPLDAWAHRELGYVLTMLGRFDEARAEAEIAEQLEPESPHTASLRGYLAVRTEGLPAARQHYRRAIELSIESVFALYELVRHCDSFEVRREELRFIQHELERQVGYGDALLIFHEVAQTTYSPEELLGVLQAALEARSDLWHAWVAVVRQHVAMHELDAAARLARRACQHFHLTPAVWRERAAVHQAQGDRAGAVSALQTALEIDTHDSLAARQLAAAHIAAENLTAAREVMENILTRDPLDAENHGALANIDWRCGERDVALDRLERSLRLQPTYNWAWDRLVNWGAAAGQPYRAVELARALSRERPGDSRCWLLVASLLQHGGPATAVERLAAVERAIELDPWNWDAYDLQAELLVVEGRFDEAEKACSPQLAEARIPISLRGRRAWVLAERGDRRRAIDEMSDVLAADAGYYWGWAQLTEWHRLEGEHADYHAAALRMTRVAPLVSVAWGYLGDAQLQLGDRVAAMASLTRAVELSPEYTFGSRTLFELYLSSHRFDDANALLERIRPYAENPAEILLQRLRLSLARHDDLEAGQRLARLCQSPSDDRTFLERARQAFQESGRSTMFQQTLQEVVDRESPPATTISMWVEMAAEQGAWRACLQKIEQLPQDTQSWETATAVLLDYASRSGQVRLVRKFIRRHNERLCHGIHTWATAGNALIHCQRHVEAQRWLSDWRERADVRPWMLLGLASSLRQTARRGIGAAINEAALQLPPDHATPLHRLWLAADALVAGDWQRARDFRYGTSADAINSYYQVLLRVIDACIGIESGASAPQYGLSFTRAYGLLRQSLGTESAVMAGDPVFTDFYRRYRWRLAKKLGGVPGRVIALLWPVCYQPLTW